MRGEGADVGSMDADAGGDGVPEVGAVEEAAGAILPENAGPHLDCHSGWEYSENAISSEDFKII